MPGASHRRSSSAPPRPLPRGGSPRAVERDAPDRAAAESFGKASLLPLPLLAMIVDDDPFARRRLGDLLRAIPGVEVVAECAGAADAWCRLRDEAAPDVIFLDVEMPDTDGFDLLAGIEPHRRPLVVFVTAHGEHAVRAFAIQALDYLLKPCSLERLHQTVDRARIALDHRRVARLVGEVAALAHVAPARPQRLVLRGIGRLVFVEPAQIQWVEARGTHTRVRADHAEVLVLDAISKLETTLGAGFLRIHRSTIVNLAWVRELEIGVYADYTLVMSCGRRLSVGRSRREAIRNALAR